MGDMSERINAVQRLTPKKGFNLVGVDSFESEPGRELFLIAHFDNFKTAEKALKKKQKESPDEKFYLYLPPSEK